MLKRERLWLATSASCLHHLSSGEKLKVLRTIRGFSNELFLEELEANHDLPQKDSLELIWSVHKFYSSLIDSVNKASLSKTQKRSCIFDFLLAEAIAILMNPKPLRGNFHTLQDEWCRICREAGFHVAKTNSTKLDRNGLRTLAFRLA